MKKIFKIKEKTEIKKNLNLETCLIVKDKNKIVGNITKEFNKDYYLVSVGRTGTQRATLQGCFDYISMLNQPIFEPVEIEFKY